MSAEFARSVWYDRVATFLFVVLLWVRLTHHEMWRDEVHVWGVVLASPTLPSLIHKLHYDVHPCLWYVVLWIASQFSTSLAAMKVVQALVGTGIYALIGLRSPFTRVERLLLFCSYFVFYEYTVLTRNYGLCFLVALAYMVQRFEYPERRVRNVILLGLLANTETIGLILAVILFVEYVWRDLNWKERMRCAALFGPALLAACWLLMPAADVSTRTTGHILEHIREPGMLLISLISNTLIPWLPISFSYPRPYWNPAVANPLFCSLLCLPILAAYWQTVRGRLREAMVLGGTMMSSILFSFLVYFGSSRHFGVIFLAYLFVLWAIRSEGIALPRASHVLLVLSGIAGLAAGAAEYHHPFSNAAVTARWLRANHLEGDTLMGTPDTSVAGLAEHLGVRAYFLDCECSDSYLVFSSRRDNFRPEQVPERIGRALRKEANKPTILVLVEPMSQSLASQLQQDGIEPKELASFTGAEAWQEDFFLYAVRLDKAATNRAAVKPARTA